MRAIAGSLAVGPAARLRGRLRLPGDKSIAHRALILGALAEGGQSARGLPDSRDVASTAACLRRLGCRIGTTPDGAARIEATRWRDGIVLDAGNSGTTARLLCGLIAGRGLAAVIDGDASLRRRPMGRVADPLVAMGARIETGPGGGLPLRLGGAPRGDPGDGSGNGALRGREHRLAVASAQVKSALLIAGLQAEGTTAVHEPAPSRDHTENLLAAMGARLERDGGRIALAGGQRLQGTEVLVPGDVSSACFLVVAATLLPGSEIVLPATGVNPTRAGALRALARMGARIELERRRVVAGEAIADLVVRAAPLGAVAIGGAEIPSLIDELPVLAVAATRAEGRTVVRDAAELRHKECDRIGVTVANLARLGARIEERPDGFAIDGPTRLRGGRVDAAGDHRIAMAMAVAGLLADGPVTIDGADTVAVSYPGFFADLATLTRGGAS